MGADQREEGGICLDDRAIQQTNDALREGILLKQAAVVGRRPLLAFEGIKHVGAVFQRHQRARPRFDRLRGDTDFETPLRAAAHAKAQNGGGRLRPVSRRRKQRGKPGLLACQSPGRQRGAFQIGLEKGAGARIRRQNLIFDENDGCKGQGQKYLAVVIRQHFRMAVAVRVRHVVEFGPGVTLRLGCS